eukprot:115116-Pyramimonas_sp.AAC.1
MRAPRTRSSIGTVLRASHQHGAHVRGRASNAHACDAQGMQGSGGVLVQGGDAIQVETGSAYM